MNVRDPEVAKYVTEKRWGGKRKHFHNARTDAAIEEAYRQYREEGSRTALVDLAKRLGWPKWRVNRRGKALGFAGSKTPYWSAEEEVILAKVGHLGDQQIRKHLRSAGFQRSETAIHLKMKRLRIKQNLEGYSATSLAVALGEDSHKIVKWIRLKMLRAEMRGQERVRDVYWITDADVRNFIAAYPNEIRLARVEKWWFLDLVSDGRITEQSGEVGRLRQKVEALLAAAQVTARRMAESEEKLRLASEEVRRLQGDIGRAQKLLRARTMDESVREEQRRMDRREINRLRRELARTQGREERPADEADSEPLNPIALIQAIGGRFQG